MSPDSPGEVLETLETLVRRESARIVGMVARVLGSLDRAEEVFQEAVVAAMERWPEAGIPDNPAGWLFTVARNRALDELRRDRLHRTKREALAREIRAEGDGAGGHVLPEAVADDRLRLVFTCCHPALSSESRVAITLKLVCGLTTAEIARAFLVSEPTVAQRLVRAKRTIRERKLPFAVPEADELPARLASVLAVVYLAFNEGYSATEGARFQRVDLMTEALRLGTLVAELVPGEAEVSGLLALMECQASRHRTRIDAAGDLVLLEEQDRRLWDRAAIARCGGHLARARAAGGGGAYHLQAEIAACHARAATWEETDWPRIAALYDDLVRVAPSPVVELNRAVAVSMVAGPAAGLAIVDALREVPRLREYHLLPATRADLLRRLRAWPDARDEYARALELVRNGSERAFLARRLAECEAHLV